MKSQLDKKQKTILRDFIKTFLPQTGTKRKNSGNELDYIHTTLDRLFIQHFEFNLTREEILNAFQELDYFIFPLKGDWDADNKIIKPSNTGNLIDYGNGYSTYNASFLYIEVKAETVRYLRKATATLPPNTNLDKYAKTTLLLENIKSFKEKQ